MESSTIHLTQWSRHGAADPRVVLVHGGAQGSETGGDRYFSAQSRLATRGWSVVAPDRPGHGRSPSPGRPDDAEADGLWVAELLGEGAHLVGPSFGGSVALAAATARPEAVRSLTLIEPAMHALGVTNPRVREFLGSMMAVHAGSPSAAEVAQRFMKVVSVPEEIAGSRGPEVLERMGEGIRRMKLPSPDWLRVSLAALGARGIPTLVVTGGWSPAFEAVGDVVAALSGGERAVTPSKHHHPQLVGDAFNMRLANFMSAADTRAATAKS